MRFFIILASVGAALARPEAAALGPYSSGGPGFEDGIALDSYAASASYPSGPRPQYGVPNQIPQVHKHVYVHVPPPEPKIQVQRRPTPPPPPPQKHYKILFIKAPTPPPPQIPEIPYIAPPAEQKTLVYVLVKKPEKAPEIVIPTPAPTQPSKPEVYFIRYKTQKEESGYGSSGVPEITSSDSYGSPSPSAPSSNYGAPSGSVPY